MRYFAYGSNCNTAVMKRKRVEFTSCERAVLFGHRLLFNKRALREDLPEEIGFANIEACADESVEGILYDIVDDHLARLDSSERFPDHYDRIPVTVESSQGEFSCFAYKAQPDKVASGLKPSRNYLNHILAAKDFLSIQYFNALDRSQTYEGECECCDRHGEVTFIREASNLFMLCQPCREARLVWGDTVGRRLTVAETGALMRDLVIGGESFSSVPELIAAALDQGLLSK